MRLAVICESEADAAALHILIEAIHGTRMELVPELAQRAGGWGEVKRTLPIQLASFHYNSDVEAVAVVVDSDDPPIHQVAHELPGSADPGCRLCYLQNLVEQKLAQLGPRPSYPPLKVAIGTPCPAVEAWYMHGQEVDNHNNESEWQRRLDSARNLKPARDQIKFAVYGKVRLSKDEQLVMAIAAGNRLRNRLFELERDFPGGFGTFARSIRTW